MQQPGWDTQICEYPGLSWTKLYKVWNSLSFVAACAKQMQWCCQYLSPYSDISYAKLDMRRYRAYSDICNKEACADLIALTFDMRLGSSAAEALVKFLLDAIMLTTKVTSARLHEILYKYSYHLMNIGTSPAMSSLVCDGAANSPGI